VPCIGDSLRDMQAAEASGCAPHLVCTGRHPDLLGQAVPADFPVGTRIHADLAACVDHLLGTDSLNTHSA
jgi:D-glycero-D-manno-heptose 1,7-bisphosphate phosphatase